MHQFNPQPEIPPAVLATDLDGTFIPLPEEPANQEALAQLAKARQTNRFKLVFATGRHYASVRQAMEEFGLPQPDWLICDVGSSIHHLHPQQGTFLSYAPYENHLQELVGTCDRNAVERLLTDIEGLHLQSPERQQRFKISYECESEKLDGILPVIHQRLLEGALPYDGTGSLDPFEHCGLIDVMPAGVSKAYALIWLSSHADFTPDEVVFAGDSGNDLAALAAGFRAIVVGNASPGLADKAEWMLRQRGLHHRLYQAKGKATSGVLEGCRHFRLL